MPLHRRFGHREQLPYWRNAGVVDDEQTELQAYQLYMSTRMPEAEDDPDFGVRTSADFDTLPSEEQAYIERGEVDNATIRYVLELVDPHLRLDD